jgi:cytochrome P450 family 142 subfamily A polypeptide 1
MTTPSPAPDPPGSDFDLLDPSWYGEGVFADYRWMRENAPVYRSDKADVWGLTRYEDVAWAERNPALLSSAHGSRPRVGPQPSMIDSDDPTHFRRRRLVSQGFQPRQVAALETHIREVVAELVDAMLAKPERRADFVSEFAAVLPMRVIGEMLGVAEEDHAKLQRWSDTMVQLSDGSKADPGAYQAAGEYLEYLGTVIAARRAEPRDDLIGILVDAEIDGGQASHARQRLTERELYGESLLLLVGGNETTRNVITGGMKELLHHPDLAAHLREDPSRIPAAVEEFLRWVSPIVNMQRQATQDVELHGVTIPEGQSVLLLYGAANRDPEVFTDPETFDVTRRPNPHVAFGAGPHFCLGSALARLEIRIALEELLTRLPDLRLAAGTGPDEPKPAPSAFIRGIREMAVEY